MASEAYHDWSGEAADAQLRVNFTLKLLLSQNFCNRPLINKVHKFCFQHWSRGRGTCGTGSGAPVHAGFVQFHLRGNDQKSHTFNAQCHLPCSHVHAYARSCSHQPTFHVTPTCSHAVPNSQASNAQPESPASQSPNAQFPTSQSTTRQFPTCTQSYSSQPPTLCLASACTIRKL